MELTWHNMVSDAVELLNPGSLRGLQFNWGASIDDPEPSMTYWDEAALGPLDMVVIQGKAEELLIAPAPVPFAVSPLQIRKALRQLGLKADVDAYVALLDEEEREEWEYCTEVRRDHAVLNAGAAALGKTDADVDDMFRLAATF